MDILICTSFAKLRGDFPEKLNLEGTGAGTTTQSPNLFWADKSSFCLLKELTLVWNDNMEQEWGDQFSNPELFPQLQVVNLKGRHGESFNLGSSFIHKIQIEKLTIAKASCEVLFQGGTVEEGVQGQPKAAHFTELELNDLPELIKIWEDNYQHASMFEKLKSFQVFGCHKLITLLPSQVLFPSLASLVISRCNGLKTLMTMPTAQSLTQLSSMKISECDKLEEILVLVEKNDGGGINMKGVTFRKLKYLELSWLKSLTSFCSGECKLSFPVLQELVVKKCPWIKSFSSSPHALISTPKLKTVQTETGSLLVQGGRLNKALMQCCKEQLACIETLNLSDSPMWRAQWFSTVYPNSFNKLKKLVVANVDRKEPLLAAVPSDKAVLLSSLESLEVQNCIALSQVFETQRVNGQGKINKMACFKNLQSITIRGCNGLKYILTAAMVLNLTLLRSMHIAECCDLVEIVGRQDEVKDNRKEFAIEFLKLETLRLERLPKLERFCQLSTTTTPALKFPALKRISIKECDQMKTFTSEFLPNERAGSTDIGDSNIPQESFFCGKKVHFPSLENLNLSDMNGLSTLFPNEEGTMLGNLKEVFIYRCPQLKYVFPASGATSLVKLNELMIQDCGGLEEIVAAAAAANKETTAIEFPNLETITLDDLPRLETFCQLGNRIALICQSLKEITIKKCHQMKTFASEMPRSVVDEKRGESHTVCIIDNGIIQEHFFCAKVQFPSLEDLILSDMDGLSTLFPNKEETVSVNLEKVEICRCHKLKYVFPVSVVATSLVKVNELKIQDCGGLEEIVAAAAAARQDEVKDNIKELAIEFLNLETLILESLPKLATFCQLGNRALKFPSLRRISIKECDKMKTFTSDMGNSDIPQEPFFGDKVLLPSLEVLRLIGVHGLNTIWHGGPLKDLISRLKEVYVRKCPALKYIFTASAATNLLELCKFEIKECDGLEEIVAKGETDDAAERFVFQKVTILKLKRLPELKCFYPGIFHTTEWPQLRELEVSSCPKVETLALEYDYKRSIGEVQVDHKIRPLFLIGKDAFPKLKKMIIRHMPNIKRIWQVASKSDGVQVDGSMTISTASENDGFSTFKQLKELMLRDLPNLVCFSSTSCTFSFSSLKHIKIGGCPDMKFFSDGILNIPEKFKCTIQLIHQADSDDKNEDGDGDEDEDRSYYSYSDSDSDSDSDDEEDGGSEDEEQFHDLNAIIKEKSEQIATEPKTEKEDHNEDASQDGDAIDENDDGNEDDPDNNDDATRG